MSMSVPDPVHCSHVGIKFNADGSARRYPGNTISCHVAHDSRLWQTLRVARDGLARTEGARCLTFLPPGSYHMTVFEGATDHVRVAGLWPSDVPLDAPLERCTKHLEQKLARFDMCCKMPLRMRVADRRDQDRPGVLVLTPFDGEENRKLRALRDRLSGLLMIRAPIHNEYVFHITLAYPVERMAPACHEAFLATQANEFAAVAHAVPVIELGLPSFCTFEDMHSFHAQRDLVSSLVPRAVTPAKGPRA